VTVFNLLLKTTVTFTVVVIHVLSSWFVMINTLSVWPALVALAVVFVFAALMLRLRAIGHAESLELRAASSFSIDGITRIAVKEGHVLEHQRGRWSKMLAIRRRNNISALNWLTSFRPLIFASGSTFQHELAWSFGLTVCRVSTLARVWLLLGEHAVNTRVHGFLEVRRSSALNRQEHLLTAVRTVSLTSKSEHSSTVGLTSQGVTLICSVIHLVLVVKRSG
jgi:hypothetical protein